MVTYASIVAVVIGWRVRLSAFVVFLFTTYVTFAGPSAAFTLNRLFVVTFWVIAAAPGAFKPTGEKIELQSVWSVRVLQFTLIVQYFTAGWCKVAHGDWMSEPNGVWSHAQGPFMTDAAAWTLRTAPPGPLCFLQYGSLAFELLAPILFGIKRLRTVGIIWGSAFHLGIAVMMYKLIYFSLQLMCFYVLFVDARTLHAVRGRIQKCAGTALAGMRSETGRQPSAEQ